MYYYKKNNEIVEIENKQANEEIVSRHIGDVEKEVTDFNGKKIKVTEKGVIETKKKYIDTVTDVYTTTKPPKINDIQRLDLVKSPAGVVSWEVTDLTKQEKRGIVKQKMVEVDKKVHEDIVAGFEYDNQTFSMSQSAQSNWLFLLTQYQAGTFPETGWAIATKDDDEYLLKKNKAEGFFKAASDHKETLLKQGRKDKEKLKKDYGL